LRESISQFSILNSQFRPRGENAAFYHDPGRGAKSAARRILAAMRLFLRYFLRGLVIVVPIALTVWVVYITFTWIDRLIKAPIPGVGFAVTIVSITAVGLLASNFVGRRVLQFTEGMFSRAPLIKILYLAVKDLVEAFVGDKKRFNRPVVVSLTSDGSAKTVGFITRDDLTFLGMRDHVAVYLPQAYNFAGQLLIVPAGQVTPVEGESSNIMAFIVSGGVSGGEGLPERPA
jgi:uncharacterized membrane protein